MNIHTYTHTHIHTYTHTHIHTYTHTHIHTYTHTHIHTYTHTHIHTYTHTHIHTYTHTHIHTYTYISVIYSMIENELSNLACESISIQCVGYTKCTNGVVMKVVVSAITTMTVNIVADI